LTVRPAAGLCDVALDNGAELVIVNAQPTPYDSAAVVTVREPIGTVLPALVSAVVSA
jgi:NAD-dependent deacetylase